MIKVEVIYLTKKNYKNMIILTLCLFSISLSGCNARLRMQEPGTTQVPGQQQGTILGQGGDTIGANPDQRGNARGNLMNTPLNNQMTTPNGTRSQAPQMTNNTQKSEQIKSQLQNIPGVDDVSVVVNNNSCLVGYKPSGAAGDVKATKEKITKKVKELDKSITDVRVSESADIMSRIKKLSTEFTNSFTTNGANNGPMDEISNSFNKLMNEIK